MFHHVAVIFLFEKVVGALPCHLRRRSKVISVNSHCSQLSIEQRCVASIKEKKAKVMNKRHGTINYASCLHQRTKSLLKLQQTEIPAAFSKKKQSLFSCQFLHLQLRANSI